MHNSPLVRTLQLLRQEELDTLYLFVQSPIFNIVRLEETLDLFEYLKTYYPLFDHQALHREQAGRHFFPQSKDSVATLHRTMTQLMAIVRKFITFQHWTAIEENAARQKGSAAPVAASMHDTRQRLALMRSIRQASVVDLPLAAGPVTRTSPFFTSARRKISGGICIFSGFGRPSDTTRNTMANELRC